VALVPDREGRFTIPPITFHFFDPFTNRWTSATSEAIDLTVSGISPHAITDDERDYTAAGAWVDALPQPRPIGRRSARVANPRVNPLTVVLTVLPGLLFLLVTGADSVVRHRTRTAPTRQRANAGRTALRALDDLDPTDLASAATVATTVRAWVEQVGESPTRGLRIESLRDHITELFDTQLANRLTDLVERAEMVRYSGESADVPSLIADAREAIRDGEEARS
jgi:hypothetical protein